MLSVAQANAEFEEHRVPGGVHGMPKEGQGDTIQVYVVLLERLCILHASLILGPWEGSEDLFKENGEISFYCGY
jgi:hypothetical protein